MSQRGGKGPRQPGGGRREAGPRQNQRGTRGGARFGKGEGGPGRGEGRGGKRSGEERPRSGEAERNRFGKVAGRGGKRSGDDARGKRFGSGEGGKRFGSRDERSDERGKRFEGGRKFGKDERRQRAEPRGRAPSPDRVRSAPAVDLSAQAGRGESPVPTAVQTVTVSPDENNMRVDRFFEARFPGLSFSHIQRIIRKGEVRVNGRRTEPKARLESGQSVRIPPLSVAPPPVRDDAPQAQKDRAFLRDITLYEDDDVMVLNKPMGLAVQGGSGTTRHIDGMLGALRGSHPDAQRPRLVHRLDKDTAGCLLVAKTRFAAAALAKTFRSRSARKTYWALVAGVPRPQQGRISTYLTKQEVEEDSFMRVADHGEKDAVHAVTYYAVVETSAQKLAWVSLKPVTGRTHQLRAHMAHVGHPIVGDPKYFNIENWEFPGGIQDRLHLLARRIAVPHPRGGTIDVSAPLPPHMEQSWNLLGFDTARYDPIVDAPEE
jgi:23S rRNA pseudouridine955/2504/2580 synthase